MLVDLIKGEDAPFSEICREQNWKRTSQRRAVFNCLCGNREHPTVEAIWRRVRETLPDVSLDSVYRILDDFSEAGLVRRLEGAKVIRYDADTTPHEHYVCTKCGCMFDFHFLDTPRVAEMCHEFGRVSSVELTVHGLCRLCGQKENERQ